MWITERGCMLPALCRATGVLMNIRKVREDRADGFSWGIRSTCQKVSLNYLSCFICTKKNPIIIFLDGSRIKNAKSWSENNQNRKGFWHESTLRFLNILMLSENLNFYQNILRDDLTNRNSYFRLPMGIHISSWMKIDGMTLQILKRS